MSSATLAEFIEGRKIFRFDEAVAALRGKTSAESIAVGLNYHASKKHVVRLRRGLYCRDRKEIDVWLIASRITSDAVIAYDSALRFHVGAQPGRELQVLSDERLSRFTFSKHGFRAVRLDGRRLAKELRRHPAYHGIDEVEHEGVKIRVVSRERALVDCLDRLDLTAGLDQVAHAFFKARDLMPDSLYRYGVANRSSICASRLGLLMQSHKQLHKAVSTIDQLMKLKPKSPTFFDPADKAGWCAPKWNAILPRWFLDLRGHRHDLTPPNLH